MRFQVSSAVILAHALPAAFALEDKNNNENGPDPPLPRSHLLMSSQKGGDETESLLSPPLTASKMGSGGRLANHTKSANHQQLAKAMKSRFGTGSPVGSECDPDVGILTCGMGKVCQRDDTTSLGGVCAPSPIGTRQLAYSYEEYCEDLFYEYGYSCDCSNFNFFTGTGTISCTESNQCMSQCGDVCYDLTFTYSNSGTKLTIVSCYEFTSPYEQKFCLSSSVTYSSGGYRGTCEVRVNNKKCNSCEASSYCGSWDCRNLHMGTGDFCTSEPIASIVLTECYGVDTSTSEFSSGTDPFMSFSNACTMGVSAAMVAAYGL